MAGRKPRISPAYMYGDQLDLQVETNTTILQSIILKTWKEIDYTDYNSHENFMALIVLKYFRLKMGIDD